MLNKSSTKIEKYASKSNILGEKLYRLYIMDMIYSLLIKFNPIYNFTTILLWLLLQLDLPDTNNTNNSKRQYPQQIKTSEARFVNILITYKKLQQ